MFKIRIRRPVIAGIAVAASAALIPVPMPAAHIAPRTDTFASRGTGWPLPKSATKRVAAAQGGSIDKTSVTQHEVTTFEFTLPCVKGGNPYDVRTVSDVTLTFQKTVKTDGRHTELLLGFTDAGTYTATSKHGGRTVTGSFFDSYTTVATDARFDASGAVTTAAHLSNTRVLVLTDGPTRRFFRENMAVDADDYTATTPVTDDVTCGRNQRP